MHRVVSSISQGSANGHGHVRGDNGSWILNGQLVHAADSVLSGPQSRHLGQKSERGPNQRFDTHFDVI